MANDVVKYNVLFMGVSYVGTETDSMASTMRIRNLIDPLKNDSTIRFVNLISLNDVKDNIQSNEGYENHVYFQVITYNLRNLFTIIFYFIKAFKFIRENTIKRAKNILYQYGYPGIENILFILYAKIRGYKIIFDIVEDYRFVNNFKGLMVRIKIKISLFLFNKMTFYANCCLAISSHLLKLCIKVSKNKFPVYLVPISVNFEYFHKSKAVHNPIDKINFFYGGSFGEKDGIDILLKAFENVSLRYDNVKLILTGPGSKRHLKILSDLLKISKVGNNIEYLGCLPIQEYYNTLLRSDVLCMTRINSPFANAGFPFKLGEYLATGRVVIAANIGDIPTFLKHNKNALLYEPGNENALKDAMIFCIKNPKECQRIGMKGKEVAKSKFDSVKVSQYLFNVIDHFSKKAWSFPSNLRDAYTSVTYFQELFNELN